MPDRRTRTFIVIGLLLVGIGLGAVASAQQQEPQPAINPATGQPPGAPTGCCCLPKLHPTANDRFDCKASVTEFDCKAECAELKDGRLPSGCKWDKGPCSH
jgi:hypothetical protein